MFGFGSSPEFWLGSGSLLPSILSVPLSLSSLSTTPFPVLPRKSPPHLLSWNPYLCPLFCPGSFLVLFACFACFACCVFGCFALVLLLFLLLFCCYCSCYCCSCCCCCFVVLLFCCCSLNKQKPLFYSVYFALVSSQGFGQRRPPPQQKKTCFSFSSSPFFSFLPFILFSFPSFFHWFSSFFCFKVIK